MDSFQTSEARHTSGVYAKRDLTIVRGEGATLWDDRGRAYIDCVGGQGAANLGHCHPAIVAAISQQAQRLITCPETFYNDRRAELLARLTALSPEEIDRAFLCNSGAEAVEAALKFARYSRTMGALSATWEKKYRMPFRPLVPGFEHVPYENLDRLDAVVDDATAAVILEVVQGEGGVYPGSTGYLQAAQALCRERGALLILDEVQTGFGRTGKMFAHQHHDLRPDLVCLAKSIAGGFPMGAVLIGERDLRRQPAGGGRVPGSAGRPRA